MKNPICIAILGATASKKTQFAHQLAKELSGEILCLDSTTVYKHFDIGSDKPHPLLQKEIPYHLIDIWEPETAFSAFDYVKLCSSAIEEIQKRKKVPILVGGTYFYFRALQYGMYDVPAVSNELIEEIEASYMDTDPENTLHEELKKVDPSLAKQIHPHDRYRLVRALAIYKATQKKPSEVGLKQVSQDFRYWLKYALAIPRGIITHNIMQRTDQMLQAGLVEETKKLKEKYPKAKALKSIGYEEACEFIENKINESQLRNKVIEKTRQLAKRQWTWLRADPEVRFVDELDLSRVKKEYENLSYIYGETP